MCCTHCVNPGNGSHPYQILNLNHGSYWRVGTRLAVGTLAAGGRRLSSLNTDDKDFERKDCGAALRLRELPAGKMEKDSDMVLPYLAEGALWHN